MKSSVAWNNTSQQIWTFAYLAYFAVKNIPSFASSATPRNSGSISKATNTPESTPMNLRANSCSFPSIRVQIHAPPPTTFFKKRQPTWIGMMHRIVSKSKFEVLPLTLPDPDHPAHRCSIFLKKNPTVSSSIRTSTVSSPSTDPNYS